MAAGARLRLASFRMLYRLNKWVRRRFTPAGLGLLAAIVGAAVLGVDTKRSLSYQAFTFLAALLFASAACALFPRIRCGIDRRLPRFGGVGAPLKYRIILESRSKRIQKGLTLFETPADVFPDADAFARAHEPGEAQRNLFDRKVGYHKWEWMIDKYRPFRIKEIQVPALAPGRKTEVRAELVPLRRGPLTLKRLSLARPDPLGLFRTTADATAVHKTLILPKRYNLPEFQLPGVRRHHSGGVALASSVGESEEFVALRDYRPGDSLRKIHWKSWARIGKPVVREHKDEFFVRHALILDTFCADEFSEAFEEAVSVAASFACRVLTQDSLLDLIFVGTHAYCFTSGRGLSQTENILEILASVRPAPRPDFDALTPVVIRQMAALSGCICVLLSWEAARRDLVETLMAGGVPVKVLIVQEQTSSGADPAAVDPGPMRDHPEHLHVLTPGRIQEGLDRI